MRQQSTPDYSKPDYTLKIHTYLIVGWAIFDQQPEDVRGRGVEKCDIGDHALLPVELKNSLNYVGRCEKQLSVWMTEVWHQIDHWSVRL